MELDLYLDKMRRFPKRDVNSVLKIHKLEISSKRNRSFRESHAQERFGNFLLEEKYDTIEQENFPQRSRVTKIVYGGNAVFALTESGVCGAFSRETNTRTCFLNLSPVEFIHDVFYNTVNNSVLTVSALEYGSIFLRCRSTPIGFIHSGQPHLGDLLFQTETSHRLRIVSYDHTNKKLITYDSEGVCTVYELEAYTLLYVIRDRHVDHFQFSKGTMLIVCRKTRGVVPLDIRSIEDGAGLYAHDFRPGEDNEVHFDVCNYNLFIMEESEYMRIFNVLTHETVIVWDTKSLIPVSFFMCGYKTQLILMFRNREVAIWNFRGERVAMLRDLLSWSPGHINNKPCLTSNQDIMISYCNADPEAIVSRAASINISNIMTGKLLGKINVINSHQREWKKSHVSSRSSVADGLKNVTALSYSEERNEIYTGNRRGEIHIWSN